MILEIGKLYKVTTEDIFYNKPLDLEKFEKEYKVKGHTGWPVVYGDITKPWTHLEGQLLIFLGTEVLAGDLLNKFLWDNKYVYIRYFTPVEYEYRFEEVETE